VFSSKKQGSKYVQNILLATFGIFAKINIQSLEKVFQFVHHVLLG
jgi:hypothetical protein